MDQIYSDIWDGLSAVFGERARSERLVTTDVVFGTLRSNCTVPQVQTATVTPLRLSTSSSFGISGGPAEISLSTAVNI